jgi:plasmid maintenance system killer protein
MELVIPNKKLKKALENDAERRKRFGSDMAKKLKIRMDSLAAAESLADFWPPASGPERCHEMKGDLKGQFSVDVKQPYRLLFKVQAMREVFDDERERWAAIKSIEIVSIEDTHG